MSALWLPDLSLALGSSSVGLMELVSVYGVFANQGMRVEPYAVASVQDSGGRTLEQNRRAASTSRLA